jgi:hypothetical protein
VAGLDTAADDVRAAIAASLRDGRLPLSAAASGLRARAGVLMSDERGRAAFAAIAPRATAVATATPTFRWTPLAGATAYRVRIVDAALAPVAYGEAVTTTTWRPTSPLPRGRVLLWQVEAETPDGTRTTPVPPEAEARLLVLPAAEAERAAAALTALDSDLAAAVVAARAGLYDDAEAALARLGRANPGSPEVAALRAELAARRRGR